MLTPRLRDALKYIEDEIERTGGIPPSISMIAASFGSNSKSAGHRVVAMLEERGYIRRLPGRARAIEVVRSLKPRPPWGVPAPISVVTEGPLQPYERRVPVADRRCMPIPFMGRIYGP